MKRQVIQTADGSKTLYIPELNEQYHSLNGAFTESEHVFLKNGYLHHTSTSPIIFEVGFGTGLNALLTALKAEEQKRNTKLISIEKYPVNANELNKLEYGNRISDKAVKLFDQLHQAPWNKEVKISAYFTLHKIKADLTTLSLKKLDPFDLIYFDAFAPDVQPKIWRPSIFEDIFNASRKGAVFVTYSAKGEIRRRLTASGFKMERLPGPPGKREMLRGVRVS